jgi:hypothetical protein
LPLAILEARNLPLLSSDVPFFSRAEIQSAPHFASETKWIHRRPFPRKSLRLFAKQIRACATHVFDKKDSVGGFCTK